MGPFCTACFQNPFHPWRLGPLRHRPCFMPVAWLCCDRWSLPTAVQAQVPLNNISPARISQTSRIKACGRFCATKLVTLVTPIEDVLEDIKAFTGATEVRMA